MTLKDDIALKAATSDDVESDRRDEAESGDVANTLAIEGAGQWWTEEESRRVRRKLDVHIVPWLFTTYLLAFLDRSNIGNANTAGLSKALKMSDAQYQWLLTIFYISYILFQVLLLLYKVFPPSKFMGTCVFMWGVAAILQAAAFNWSGLMAARFFIGLSEAGYGTGVALYLSFFYPRDEIGTRFAGFVIGSTIASAIAGSVAYGLQEARAAIAAWKLIFIVEAAPTLLVGILIFFFLPDSIATARFLTPHERRVAEARLYRAAIDRKHNEVAVASDAASEQGGSTGKTGRLSNATTFVQGNLNIRNGFSAFKEPMSYISSALLFIINVGFASVPVYLPTILQGMGYTSLRAQAFSAPPYAASFVTAVGASILADRLRLRGTMLAITLSIAFSGYFILATVEDNHTRYGAVWLIVLGLFTSVPLCYMFLIANSSGESKRGFALVLFGTVGQIGPVLGTRLFPSTEAPYYRRGMFVSAGLCVGGLCIVLIGICYAFVMNRRKDRELRALQAKGPRQDMSSSATDEHEKPTGANASEKSGSESGAMPAHSAIRFKQLLDPQDPADRDEIHRRRVDIAIHRESSIYWRYCY